MKRIQFSVLAASTHHDQAYPPVQLSVQPGRDTGWQTERYNTSTCSRKTYFKQVPDIPTMAGAGTGGSLLT